MSSREKLWTKGSWSWVDHGVGEIVVFNTATEMAVCILDDADQAYAWEQGYSVSMEAKANAQLISAAPDLVDALDILLKLHDNEVFTKDAWDAAMDIARSAHSKAYGDSQ